MHEKIEQAKTHFRENKKIYFTGAACLLAGAAGALVLAPKDLVFIDSFKLINWKSSHVSQTVLIRRGHPGNVIRCEQTGELFASQNRVAEVMGLNSADLSRHLSGKEGHSHVRGYTFTKLGEAQAA